MEAEALSLLANTLLFSLSFLSSLLFSSSHMITQSLLFACEVNTLLIAFTLKLKLLLSHKEIIDNKTLTFKSLSITLTVSYSALVHQ